MDAEVAAIVERQREVERSLQGAWNTLATVIATEHRQTGGPITHDLYREASREAGRLAQREMARLNGQVLLPDDVPAEGFGQPVGH